MSEIGSEFYRVFVFSQQQLDRFMEIEQKKTGRTPRTKSVIVNGLPKVYTEILKDAKNCRYSDALILIDGDIRRIKYEK